MQGSRALRIFSISAGVLLAITGAAKLISTMSKSPVVDQVDPIFGLSFRTLFLIVGVVELAIAFGCLAAVRRLELSTALLAGLATSFLLYRIGLRWMDYQKPCKCLGTLTDSLDISPAVADTIMVAILFYLLAGSYLGLFWLWKRTPGTAPEVREQTPA